MAYITTAEVKEIRNSLKEAFGPGLKFGVKKQHYSSVKVTIKKGNVDFSDIMREGDHGYAQINHYHTHMYGEHAKLFDKIVDIIKTAPGKAEGGREWFDESDSMVDYFHTAFYFNLEVGNYGKPYIYEPKAKSKAKAKKKTVVKKDFPLEGEATKKQLWALYCLTKEDHRNMSLTKKEAHDKIQELVA